MTSNYFKNFNIIRKKLKKGKIPEYKEIHKAEQELRNARKILNSAKKKYDNLPPEGQETLDI